MKEKTLLVKTVKKHFSDQNIGKITFCSARRVAARFRDQRMQCLNKKRMKKSLLVGTVRNALSSHFKNSILSIWKKNYNLDLHLPFSFPSVLPLFLPKLVGAVWLGSRFVTLGLTVECILELRVTIEISRLILHSWSLYFDTSRLAKMNACFMYGSSEL